MAELIQHILSLPQPTQLAIMQAILANMQANQEPAPGLTGEVSKYQIDRVEQIIREIESGRMAVLSKEDAWAEIRARKAARKGV